MATRTRTRTRQKDLNDIIAEKVANSKGFNFVVPVRFTAEQFEQISQNSMEEYGEVKRSTFIREVMQKHYFRK